MSRRPKPRRWPEPGYNEAPTALLAQTIAPKTILALSLSKRTAPASLPIGE